MNNRKRSIEIFIKQVGKKFGMILHQRLEMKLKEQLCTLLQRNEYSPHNMNQRHVLAYVFLQIIQQSYLCIFTNNPTF